MKLRINEELSALIPALQPEEYELLEKSLLSEGCRDSLIIWNDTIIDGHNRYKICTKHNIKFDTQEMEFNELGDVKKWMINNQLARRNLTDSQRKYFIGKRYEEENKGHGGNREVASGNSYHLKTSEIIAKENNIGERTVRNNADYSKAIDEIKTNTPELAEKILREEIKLNNKEVLEISDIEPEQRIEILKEIEKGTPYKEIKKPHVAHNSGNNEWYTPIKLLDIARKVMGSIDTDPASSEIANRNVRAKTYYTEQSNGLDQEWNGNVWMNPPYAQPLIQQFANKLIKEIENGNTKQAMVLVNNATETKWFNTLSEKAAAIWFIKGRVKFIDSLGNSTGAPLQGQAVLYFGENIEVFFEHCEGLVCRCEYK